jgi:AGZA family xanthine/uracil permease-like MFS transporter
MSTGIPAGKSGFKPILWTPGDWNAFFCFGTNILVVTGLLLFVLKMPGSLVFGRILPALGLMMSLSTFYYAGLPIGWRKRPAAPTSARFTPASASRTCLSWLS